MAQFKEIDDYNFPFEIGVMRDRGAALKFADYLNSIGIKATAKPGFGANYSIYVANEADVSKAKLELLRFGNNPFAKAYNQAAWAQGKTPKRERTVSSRTGFLQCVSISAEGSDQPRKSADIEGRLYRIP